MSSSWRSTVSLLNSLAVASGLESRHHVVIFIFFIFHSWGLLTSLSIRFDIHDLYFTIIRHYCIRLLLTYINTATSI
jgi:hypothetical protein